MSEVCFSHRSVPRCTLSEFAVASKAVRRYANLEMSIDTISIFFSSLLIGESLIDRLD